jgi:hypothetical protein
MQEVNIHMQKEKFTLHKCFKKGRYRLDLSSSYQCELFGWLSQLFYIIYTKTEDSVNNLISVDVTIITMKK